MIKWLKRLWEPLNLYKQAQADIDKLSASLCDTTGALLAKEDEIKRLRWKIAQQKEDIPIEINQLKAQINCIRNTISPEIADVIKKIIESVYYQHHKPHIKDIYKEIDSLTPRNKKKADN